LHAGLLQPPLTSLESAVSFPKPFPAGGVVGQRLWANVLLGSVWGWG
jgi:hypothetical protein